MRLFSSAATPAPAPATGRRRRRFPPPAAPGGTASSGAASRPKKPGPGSRAGAGAADRSGRPAGAGSWRRRLGRFRWGRWLLGLVLAGLLLPVVEVAAVRFVNPPVTPLMLLRWVEARFSGGRYHARILYRWRDWRALPDDFLRAAWDLEDSRFFRHHGFDWTEFRQAMAKSERTGRPPRGTSTITMQCARSLFLWQGHSYVRKALEAYFTFWMETLLSKRRIFELYANVIEMGDGVYGIEAASELTYHKPAARLTTGEAISLAAILPSPRRWNPRRPTEKMRLRLERARREMPLLHWPPGIR